MKAPTYSDESIKLDRKFLVFKKQWGELALSRSPVYYLCKESLQKKFKNF